MTAISSYTQPNVVSERKLYRLSNPTAIVNTSKGVFKLELFAAETPITVQNFLKLCRDGFYNGLTFHRVIDGFMIQGGCPLGDGSGGPGYVIKDEFVASLNHNAPGMLSMANAGPNTGGSQFFITLAPTPWLDGKHTIFGKVVEGLDVVQLIGKVRTGRQDRPLETVKINTINITQQ